MVAGDPMTDEPGPELDGSGGNHAPEPELSADDTEREFGAGVSRGDGLPRRPATLAELDALERLLELANAISPGPWTFARSKDGTGALILWDGDEPLALIYAGIDFCKYLVAAAPAVLFAGRAFGYRQ
jgi:hypothetical protein